MAQTSSGVRDLDRFEAFTDAVFAIGLTLLFVNLKIPGQTGGPSESMGLAHALLGEWKSYLALILSFSIIGVYWLQHHYTGLIYIKVDHLFSGLNLIFLFFVILLPLPIGVWATHLGTADEALASQILVFSLLLPAVAWFAKFWYAATGGRLTDDRLQTSFIRLLFWQYGLSVGVFLFAAFTSLVFARASVILALCVNALYILPPRRIDYEAE